jgi:tyrosinase
MATQDVTTSRYGRVKEILTHAAGDSKADYGLPHHQAPWDLPLDKLLLASLYGVRLIAPEKEPVRSCCGHQASETAAARRAARSGLIQGMRGDPPFDGSQFPRLPWGGQAVAEGDILFIARWIDDGCPTEDRGLEIGAYDLAPHLVVIEREGYEVYEGTPNEYKYQHGEIKQRVNIDCMTPPQLEKLRWAFRELYRLNKWPLDARNFNNLALIHQNHCQHGWERFLPWHRVYMYEFEQAIQDHCPDVTLPYWDWAAPQYPTNPIPNALQAYLTKPALDALGVGDPHLSPDDIATLWENLNGKLFPNLSGFLDEVAKLMGRST